MSTISFRKPTEIAYCQIADARESREDPSREQWHWQRYIVGKLTAAAWRSRKRTAGKSLLACGGRRSGVYCCRRYRACAGSFTFAAPACRCLAFLILLLSGMLKKRVELVLATNELYLTAPKRQYGILCQTGIVVCDGWARWMPKSSPVFRNTSMSVSLWLQKALNQRPALQGYDQAVTDLR